MNQTKEKYDAENRPYCQQIIKNLRHELHRCAELSMKEFRTKGILMNYIRENTSCEVVDKKHTGTVLLCSEKHTGKHTETHGDGPFVFGKAHRKEHRGDDPFVLTNGKCFSPKRNTLGRSFCVCWKSPRGNTWEQP